MNKHGEIIIVADDPDDQFIVKWVFKELGVRNKITYLQNGLTAYEYFNNTDKDPFIIISDINMPLMSGMELRDKMQQEGELRLRKIPFLFPTTGVPDNNIIQAYSHSVQGFFTKPSSYKALKDMIKAIIDYWSASTEPKFHVIGK